MRAGQRLILMIGGFSLANLKAIFTKSYTYQDR
jgi:hypothetical protein